MNLVQILRERVAAIDAGDHTPGLLAVLRHVEAAERHLTRGSSSGDEDAFTDVIYRTNQAFEGALKEAYRVLAATEPARKTPFEIENYLQSNAILRPRVVDQLKAYRTEWRNPSTHDYRIDFDDDEALLAIISVSAFAIVLIDQIAAKLGYQRSRAAPSGTPAPNTRPLLAVTSEVLRSLKPELALAHASGRLFESQLAGLIAGALEKAGDGIRATVDVQLSTESRERVDLLVERGAEKVVVELKQARYVARRQQDAIAQMVRYMEVGQIKQAILYLYFDDLTGTVVETEHPGLGEGRRLLVIGPRSGGQ